MNPELDYGGSGGGGGGNGKLRQWLIEQVDCGKYPGLVWENDDKSIFRIPWKHAGKQDYNRDEDAALFKAWALFKGKFREGVDKADPPTWKTRLRCALNKSNDFEELVERSQLDISDPYKVYRVIPEGAKKRPRPDDSPLSYQVGQTTQMPQYLSAPECSWRDYCQEQTPELSFPQCPCPPRPISWQAAPPMDNSYQLRASIYSCLSPADAQAPAFTLDAGLRSAEALSDLRLHVSVFVRETLVREVTTSSPKGCHITPCFPEDKLSLPPGAPDIVPLPPHADGLQRRPSDPECPPPGAALERGVLVWMGADGLYACRLCEGRVYWQSGDKLNKLERQVTCKLLTTQDFLSELQSFGLHGRALPRFQVLLSFGDECLSPQRQRWTLSVQVEPLFARQLLYYAQQTGGSHYYHHRAGAYELPAVSDHHLNFSEDFPRGVAYHQLSSSSSSSLQE